MRRPLAAILFSLGIAHGASAQPTLSLEDALTLAPAQLETGQVVLGYLGPTEESIPPLVITTEGHDIDWAILAPWMDDRAEFYQRARGAQPSFRVTPQELQAILRALKQARDTGPEEERTMAWVSVTVVTNDDGARGLRVDLSRAVAGDFFVLLRNAVRADPKDITLMEGQVNVEAMRSLQWWGCALDLLPEGIPAKDATGQVRAEPSGLRWNQDAGRFESTVTLTNTSPQPIRGPIALVVDFSESFVQLLNAQGTTCATSPVGREFVNVPMPTESLAPGASLEMVLEFERDAGTEVQFTTKVLAGPGER